MLTKKFFFEGDTEKKFLLDIAQSFFGVTLTTQNLFNTNGYNQRWIELNDPIIEKTLKQGYTPVLLVDADNNFADRTVEIMDALNARNYDINFFVFPNNNDNGTIEDLLINLTNTKNKPVLDCFNSYTDCISGYSMPTMKSRIYAYLDALLPSNQKDKIKEKYRDYLDPEIWDLKSSALTPFIDFLKSI